MAVAGDSVYLQALLDRHLIVGPVLEVGSHNRQQHERGNTRRLLEERGLAWEGTDIDAGPDVDFTLDLLDSDAVSAVGRTWNSVLVMNLLEHVYDPIRVLQNVLQLTAPGGTCVVVGPVVWQLHDFPKDYWRPMPDFFIEFARRNGATTPDGTMHWIVGPDRIIPIGDLHDGDQKLLPSAHTAARVYGPRHSLWSRAVHKLANTTGRQMFFPFVGLGVCLRLNPDSF